MGAERAERERDDAPRLDRQPEVTTASAGPSGDAPIAVGGTIARAQGSVGPVSAANPGDPADRAQRSQDRPRSTNPAVSASRIQFRLRVGAVDDPEEAEADRVAAQVMRRIRSGERDQRDAITGTPTAEVSRIRRTASAAGGPVDADLEQRIRRASTSGRALPERARTTMESGFGADLSAVRVHTGPAVDDLNDRLGARAFTVGNDVYFRGGVPDTSTTAGGHLVAHELAHTFQQGAVRRTPLIRRKKDQQPVLGNFWTDLANEVDEAGEELRQFAAKQFGVTGMPRFGIRRRSEEARKWRARIKFQAREQARADVDAALDDPNADFGRSLLGTEKAFYRLKAKKEVYDTAKASVNTAVQEAVDEVVEELWSNQSFRIYNISLRAYTAHKLGAPDDYEGARTAARAKLAELLAQAKNDAKNAKRVVFAKDNAPAAADRTAQTDAAALTMESSAMQQRARKKVTDEGVGLAAVRETIEADTVEKGMGVLGKLLDHVVGTSGDQVSLAIEFKVPLDPSGVSYVQFTLTGKAARGIDGAMTAGVPVFGDPRRLEVMAEFQFRIGTGIADLLDIGANLTFFARGGANDTELCMKALSYGAYRRLGAISDTAANWWSGADAGLRDAPGYQRGADSGVGGKAHYAESWAAMVEEQAFKEGGAFVDVGVGLGASGKLSLGEDLFGGIEVAGGASAFHRYDHDALSESLGASYATAVADKKAAKDRRAAVSGSGGASYSVSAKVTLNFPGAPKLELAASLSGSITDPHSFGIEITGSIGYASGSTDMIERWAVGYASGVADLMRALTKAGNAYYNDRTDAGAFTDAMAGTAQAIDAGLENQITDGLAEAWKVAEGPAEGLAGLVTSSSLQVALIIGTERYKETEDLGNGYVRQKKRLKPIIRIEIRSGRKLEINTPMAGAAGVKITAEKTTRLFAVGVNTGKDERPGKNEGARRVKLDAEFAGFRTRGKTNQRGKKGR